ncbi:hypothetical protein, partial [Neisseria meningitidis]|uniref:hypothetical protein n=1 Tax=Neisseria meningitidis TaxID=487 RepID=UPI001C859F49
IKVLQTTGNLGRIFLGGRELFLFSATFVFPYIFNDNRLKSQPIIIKLSQFIDFYSISVFLI